MASLLTVLAVAASLGAAPPSDLRLVQAPSPPQAPPLAPPLAQPKPAPDAPPGVKPTPDASAPDANKKSPTPPKSADKPAGPPGANPGAANKKAAEKPGLAVVQPRSAAERDQALANLYAHLATAADEAQAKTIAASIEALWATPGSDTIGYLMGRAQGAMRSKDYALSIKLYDAIVGLAPDYAEGWNQRALAHVHNKDYERAMGDVRRTLALDPNHFGALDGLMHILQETGRKKEALKVGRQLLDVNPFHDGAKNTVEELAREVEGRGI